MQTSLIFKKVLTNLKYYSMIRRALSQTWHSILNKEEFLMFENVKQFLVDELRVKAEDVTMEAELAGDLGINSLELAELVLACEEKFNVVIEDDDLHNFNTVGDIVTYLENNQ